MLGVRDYLGKNGFRSALIGLSGGVDSALTLCIAAVAIHYLPNTYDAWGQIYVAPQTPLASAAEGVSLGGNGYGNPNVVLTTLLNDDNLEKIVKRIDPAAASKAPPCRISA